MSKVHKEESMKGTYTAQSDRKDWGVKAKKDMLIYTILPLFSI